MKKLLLALSLGCALMMSQTPAFAGATGDAIKAGMGEARENLMAMLAATDNSAYAQKQEAIKAATAKVDAAITGADADTAAKLKEFSSIWGEFKNTRDTQIIPAIVAGKKDEAKSLAEGVQAERIKKMKAILETL